MLSCFEHVVINDYLLIFSFKETISLCVFIFNVISWSEVRWTDDVWSGVELLHSVCSGDVWMGVMWLGDEQWSDKL